MTCEEQDAFLDAVTQLKEAGIFDDFSRVHIPFRPHGNEDFVSGFAQYFFGSD